MAVQFQLKSIQLRGVPSVSADGKTLTQSAAVFTTIVGNPYSPKFDQVDVVSFSIDATLTVVAAQTNLQAQAAAYVAKTYPNVN